MSQTRPAPDPTKLARQFAEWTSGETLVGRMLANLKTGGLPVVLESAGDGPHALVAAGILEWWQGWEQGTIWPPEVAAGLREAGIEVFLADVAGQ